MKVVAVALVCLAGCTSEPPALTTTGDQANGGDPSAPAPATAGGAAAAGGIDPNLPEEIAMVVTMLKDKLPLRQGDATIVAMEAKGAEIIHTIKVPQDLDAATFAHFQVQLPVRTCGDPQARWAVDRGGTITYKILDKSGELFTASVMGCPVAVPLPVDDPAAAPPPPEGM